MDENGKFNFLLVCYHLLNNILAYTSCLWFIFTLVQFTAPDQTCDAMLQLFSACPNYGITIAVIYLLNNSIQYYICYKYAVTNERIKVATGKMITDSSAKADTEMSFYQSNLDYEELLQNADVRDHLRKGLSEQDPMAQIVMCMFTSNLKISGYSVEQEPLTLTSSSDNSATLQQSNYLS